MSLAAFAKPGRFYRGNLHTHSTNSDGARSPEYVCTAYREAGYDFLMLSDHFLARYGFPVTDTRDFRRPGFTTIIGAEIHAPATRHGELWHIVAAGLPLDFEAPAKNETAYSLARRAHDAGAFIGLAHPAWSGMSIEEARAMDMAHAVEIYNHVSALEADRADGFYVLDALLNEGRRLGCYATDDAHFHHDDHFGAWINVKAESLEPEALVEAIKAGETYSSQGPQIHLIAIDGEDVVVESSPARRIAVLGRGQRSRKMEIGAINGPATRGRLPLGSFRGDWLRIVVFDEAGRRAWSNPIWP